MRGGQETQSEQARVNEILEQVRRRRRHYAIHDAMRSLPYGPGIVPERSFLLARVGELVCHEAISPRSSWENLRRYQERERERLESIWKRMEAFYDEEEIGLLPRYRVRCEGCEWTGYRVDRLVEIYGDEYGVRRKPCPRCEARKVIPIKRVLHSAKVRRELGLVV